MDRMHSQRGLRQARLNYVRLIHYGTSRQGEMEGSLRDHRGMWLRRAFMEIPRKKQSGHSREDNTVRAFLGEHGFFLSITAHANKDLINDFWLLGWHCILAGLGLAVFTHLSPRGVGGDQSPGTSSMLR